MLPIVLLIGDELFETLIPFTVHNGAPDESILCAYTLMSGVNPPSDPFQAMIAPLPRLPAGVPLSFTILIFEGPESKPLAEVHVTALPSHTTIPLVPQALLSAPVLPSMRCA
jgi:hypothetical protein